jgi:hypothetical protein
MNLDFFIIDCTTPFLQESKQDFINWSKIPYHDLERNGEVHDKTFVRIFKNFKKYIKKIKDMGYNAISIDDLAHITTFKFYPDMLKEKIRIYRKKMAVFFKYAEKEGLKIFLTTDIMFYNRHIRKFVRYKNGAVNILLGSAIKKAFKRFKQLSGIIFRIGESDGIDVSCEFKSKLHIKTPGQANEFIRKLLPLFEENGKYFIFRTWTTGAYRIGDLMWNEKTFNRAFRNINSDFFILSMKYGDADFFRYLELNEMFFVNKTKKIIELQTRREYEGFGEFPSFTGYDYHDYYRKLKGEKSLCGIYVWCQTGGWSSFRNFTFLTNTSFWNELNTYTAIRIFKNGADPEKSAVDFYDGKKPKLFLKFLGHSEYVIKNLLYDPGFVINELYFNKVRIPPLIHVFWQNFTLTDITIMMYSIFNKNPGLSLDNGRQALDKIVKMRDLSSKLGIPYNAEFHYDTFKLFNEARTLIYCDRSRDKLDAIKLMIRDYKSKYRIRYEFYINIRNKISVNFYKILLSLLIRKRKKYRFIDRLLFNSLFSKVLLFFYMSMKKKFPEFSGTRAMPFSTFLK